MRLRKLLTVSLAGALLVGMVATTSAAELDTAWYAAQNPDVVAALGNSPEALKLHYEMFGKKEGRMANTRDVEAQLRRLFKAEEYAARYPDIKAAFGANTEAMFQHYIAYGLLEGRRPSEKVSQAAATSLKKTVEKAMADAGIAAVPGSAQLVEVITGTIAADKGGAALQQALQKAAPAIEKAVADTAKEAANPTPAASSGGGSSSSSSGGSSSGSSSSGGSSSGGTTPTPPAAYEYETVSGSDPESVKAIVANFVDHGVSGNDVSANDTPNETLNTQLSTLKTNMDAKIKTTVQKKKGDPDEKAVAVVEFEEPFAIPQHGNGNQTLGYWIGIGIKVPTSATGTWYYADSKDAAVDAVLNASEGDQYTSEMPENYRTFYWNLPKNPKWGYLAAKGENGTTYRYVIDFTKLSRGDDRPHNSPPNTSSESEAQAQVQAEAQAQE